MTATIQLATVDHSSGVHDRSSLPKRNTLVSQPTRVATASESTRSRIAWPILTISLGVGLTVAWTVFLAWGAAVAIAMVLA